MRGSGPVIPSRSEQVAPAVDMDVIRVSSAHRASVLAAGVGPVVLGVVLWALALPHVAIERMTDAGLVSVLPLQAFVGLALVVGAFIGSVATRQPSIVLGLQLTAAVLILFGTPCIVESSPHIAATWRHIGIVDYIEQTHHVNPKIDAYFNWPGFFIFGAYLSEVTGANMFELARWAPLFYDLAFLIPVYVIARTVTTDRRLAWATVWFFTVANWVAQDYFSPQATTYLIYLVVLALLLSWFAPRPAPRRAPSADGRLRRLRATFRPASGRSALERALARGSAAQRALVLLVVIVAIGATVPSHQLTPFAILGAALALVAVRACAARGLPLIVLVMIASWVTFMAVEYLSGHFGSVAGSVGKVDQNVSSSLGARLQGSPAHMAVIVARLALTGGFGVVALVGAWRRFRRGYRDVPMAALACAPVALVGLQSYGGEILMRIFLFALPFLAFFAAAAFFTAPSTRTSWRTIVAFGGVSSALVAGFLISRYGNERTDWFSGPDIAAARQVSSIAPKGSRLVSLSRDYPRKFDRYDDFRFSFVSELPVWKTLSLDGEDPRINAAVGAIRVAMRSSGVERSYLIVTRSQVAYLETFSGATPSAMKLLTKRLRRSPDFRTVYANSDAFVLRLRSAEGV